ncbi:MAG: S8 family serine peptidase [Oscillospiraceae bacterium]|nr:S8 family serine peptidase [Oscillospiraceae bacterium]
MKIKRIICVLLTAVTVFTCLPFSVSAKEIITADYVEDEVVFEYAPPISSGGVRRAPAAFRSMLKALGVTELKALDNYDDEIHTSSVSSESTTYVAKISGDVEKTCREIEKISGVRYAEPNYLLETYGYTAPLEITNGLANYTNYEKWYLDTVMNIPAAWKKYQTCGEGVTVAVIDNGFYIDAADFPTNLWDDGNGNHGWNTANGSSDISPVYKSDGTALKDTAHGSNVAGIIGMASNGSNFVGAAFGAELMLLRVANGEATDKDTTLITSAAVANAIVYARVNGADVISISLGINNAYPTAIKNAVDDAYADSICIVAAAGNNGTGTSSLLAYPAAASNVIGVMASSKTSTSELTTFSNYDQNNGQYYDIVAPGEAIVGCGIEAGRFSVMNGTSQATPLVAACIALYASVYPEQTVDKIFNSLREFSGPAATSNPTVSTDTTYTYKMLDAVKFLDFGATKPEIEFNLNTTVIHDSAKEYIYGLDEGFADIASYVTVKDGTGTAELVQTANGNGTGSQLKIYTLKGELYKTFTIIIFGDVNGDCKADGMDAVIMGCMTNGMGEYDNCVTFAADVDFDGSVSDTDIETVKKYAIKTGYISQIR